MKKLLLVDDDITFLNLLGEIAEGYGWKVNKASSVAQAGKLLLQESYDKILIDYSMRDGTAIDVLNFIKDNSILCPAVVLSGHSEDTIRNAVLQAGAEAYFEKGGDIFSKGIF